MAFPAALLPCALKARSACPFRSNMACMPHCVHVHIAGYLVCVHRCCPAKVGQPAGICMTG